MKCTWPRWRTNGEKHPSHCELSCRRNRHHSAWWLSNMNSGSYLKLPASSVVRHLEIALQGLDFHNYSDGRAGNVDCQIGRIDIQGVGSRSADFNPENVDRVLR